MSSAHGELRAWLEVAEQAARLAGELLAPGKGSGAIVTAEVGRDVKLAADWESEECIIRVLQERSGFPILSEERGNIDGKDLDQGLRWVVDPLDGSLNYLKGIQLCCVSIGLWDQDEPLLGVIYDFNHGEMFTGIVGRGAWLNGAAITKPPFARCGTGWLGE